jgi:hypothetical protein
MAEAWATMAMPFDGPNRLSAPEIENYFRVPHVIPNSDGPGLTSASDLFATATTPMSTAYQHRE